MEGICLAKPLTCFLLRPSQDVMDSEPPRSETYQAAIGKWENQSTYFFEKEERRNERYQGDDRYSKTREKVWVLFPEFSAEESWEANTRFCKASSYQ